MTKLNNCLLRLFRKNVRGGLEAFNCHEQTDVAWLDRAKIAADMVSELVQNDELTQIRLADIGCGDQKFCKILLGQVDGVSYSGFDLLPQSDSVIPFNVDTDLLPTQMDIAVLLGVLEYSDDIPAALLRLRPRIQYLVVSHAVRDRRAVEFAETLNVAGFTISKSRVTSNGRSIVWECT